MTDVSSTDNSLVTYSRDGHVGFITLTRPDKRNALNLKMWDALDVAVDAAEWDHEVRVIILRGEGKSFCAGLDLSPDNELIPMIMCQPNAAQKVAFFREVKRIQAIHTRLERLPIPTIAAIHGHCLGAGLEMVLCCDIRLACSDTLFGLPEARLAIITDIGGLQRIERIVGRGHAMEIAFRGHRFAAGRARAINLVNDIYPDKDTLDQKALELAQEIASNPPMAVQGAKDVMLFGDLGSMERSLDYNAARSAMIMPSLDLMEAMAAYMEKREGNFKNE
jgi:enoyl-CoA hydratase